MKIVRFVFASSLSSCHVHVNIISQHFCGIRFLKMATFSSLTEALVIGNILNAAGMNYDLMFVWHLDSLSGWNLTVCEHFALL